VALAAVALLLVAIATAFGVRLILDEGFTGLPPDGATPSAPESGEIVLFYHGPSEFRPGFNNPTKVFVYSDGRLITTFSGAPLLEQRLTAEGVELLRSEVVSTLLRPDHPSPETKYVPFWFAVEVRDGEQLVKLSDEAVPATLDVDRFVTRLAHPESWLPASAWAERRVRAYVPTRYGVCYGLEYESYVALGTELARGLSALPAKARELLSAAGLVFAQDEPAPGQAHNVACSTLTTAEARALAEALEDGGLDPDEFFGGLNYEFPIPGLGTRGGLEIWPLLPDGGTATSGW
jgi:hypothetical protein